MIQNIDVIVNPSSITKSKYNSITGEIFFQIGSEIFPEEKWNDFIVVLLNWWLNALKKFYELKSNNFEMSFMDGPLTVKCTLIADEILELCFVKEYTDGEDIFLSTECIVDNLKKSLLAAARKVLREINNRKWDTPDIVSLRNIAESWEQFVD